MNEIEVLKELRKDWKDIYACCQNGTMSSYKPERKIIALDEALLALDSIESLKARVTSLSEQKEKLPELLADFVLTLYKPNELIFNDSLAGGKGKTKEQFIKKAEVFLNE